MLFFNLLDRRHFVWSQQATQLPKRFYLRVLLKSTGQSLTFTWKRKIPFIHIFFCTVHWSSFILFSWIPINMHAFFLCYTAHSKYYLYYFNLSYKELTMMEESLSFSKDCWPFSIWIIPCVSYFTMKFLFFSCWTYIQQVSMLCLSPSKLYISDY